jgi:hypothetical protein
MLPGRPRGRVLGLCGGGTFTFGSVSGSFLPSTSSLQSTLSFSTPRARTDNPLFTYKGDASLSLTPTHPGWGTDIVRLTTSGENSTTVMNGIPPWVYEEEVFGSDWTIWFSGGAGGGEWAFSSSFSLLLSPIQTFS